MDSCYEQPADGKRAGFCSVCKQIKNISKFDQRVSRVGTSERGYAGNVRLAIERTICSDCRPKRKPIASKTRKEIVSMAAAGDIHSAIAEDIIKKKEAELREKQRRAGVKTAFDRHHKEKWAALSAALAKEQQAVRMQVYNMKKSGGDVAKPELYAFATRYFAALSAQREMYSIDKARMRPPPADTWQDAIDEDTYRELDALHHAVPTKDKAYPTRTPAFYDRTAREQS